MLSIILGISYHYVYGMLLENKGVNTSLLIGIDDSSPYNLLGDTTITRTINKLVFSTLFTLDNQNNPSPLLAQSWDTDPNLTQIHITLNPAIKWEDGTQLKSDDVIYSFNLQKKLNPKGIFATISMNKVDDTHLDVEVTGIDVNIWQHLLFPILPSHTVYSKYEEIGTGPYVLASGNNSSYTLIANPTYFRGKPKIQSITIKTYTDQESMYTDYVQGNINAYILSDPNSNILHSILNDTEDHIISQSILSTYNALFFNMTRLKDDNIRKAISYGINKKVISNLLEGYDQMIDGPINANSWAYSNDPSIIRYSYDQTKAMAALQAAGYTMYKGKLINKDGVQISLSLAYEDSVEESVIHILATQIQALGIQVVLIPYSQSNWTSSILERKDFDIAYVQVQGNVDPDNAPLWQSGASSNLSSYANVNVDHALDLARNTTDKSLRKRAYILFQKNIMNDKPAVFLYSPVVLAELKPNIIPIGIDNNLAFDVDILSNIQNWYVK